MTPSRCLVKRRTGRLCMSCRANGKMRAREKRPAAETTDRRQPEGE